MNLVIAKKKRITKVILKKKTGLVALLDETDKT